MRKKAVNAKPKPLHLAVANAPEETEAAAKLVEQKPESIVRGRIWLADGGSLEGAEVFLWGGRQPGSEVDGEGYFDIRCPWEMGTMLYLRYEEFQLALQKQVVASFTEDVYVEIEVDNGEEVDLLGGGAAVQTGDGRRPLRPHHLRNGP